MAYDELTRLFLYVDASLTAQLQRAGNNHIVIHYLKQLKQDIQTLRCKFHNLQAYIPLR